MHTDYLKTRDTNNKRILNMLRQTENTTQHMRVT